jgi:hypothetical protein
MDPVEKLRDYLSKLQVGKITSEKFSVVRSMILDCWDLLDVESDWDRKKFDRMENLVFVEADTLTFWIERHGAYVLGSVYANIHKWTIDLAKRKATCDPYAKRLMIERSKPLKVEPLVQAVINDIVNNNRKSEVIDWVSDNKVKVLIGKIIPEGNWQTTSGRRKRFRGKLDELLIAKGWEALKTLYLYERKHD